MNNLVYLARCSHGLSLRSSKSGCSIVFPSIASSVRSHHQTSIKPLLPLVPFYSIQYRYAGHSKWQNIRHTKGANDQRKGVTASKFAIAIKKEATRGPDPKLNPTLAKLIETAIKCGVTKDTINRNIEKAKNVKFVTHTCEILGPGGCFILCNIDAENAGKARQELKAVVKGIASKTNGKIKG